MIVREGSGFVREREREREKQLDKDVWEGVRRLQNDATRSMEKVVYIFSVHTLRVYITCYKMCLERLASLTRV